MKKGESWTEHAGDWTFKRLARQGRFSAAKGYEPRVMEEQKLSRDQYHLLIPRKQPRSHCPHWSHPGLDLKAYSRWE